MRNIVEKYALAFISLDHDRGEVDGLFSELGTVVQALFGSDIAALISNPAAPARMIRKILLMVVAAWEEQGFFLTEKSRAFLRVVVNNRHLCLLPAVVNRIEELLMKIDGVLSLEVTSAVEMSVRHKQEVMEIMQSKYPGQQLKSTFAVDRSLFRGMVVKVNDLVLDLSLSHKLKKLRREFCV